MQNINKRISQEIDEMDRLIRDARIQKRQEREKLRKEANHWNFLAGKLVAKYLKDSLDITVCKGKDAAKRNAAAFESLENILVNLAADHELLERLMEAPDRTDV